jgi:hypothetical protein
VFLRAKSEGVNVNTLIRIAGVCLVRLNPREVRSFTLREAVLAVQLKLGSDNGVLAPTVKVQRGLAQNERTSIRDSGVIVVAATQRCKKLIGFSSTDVRVNGRSIDAGSVYVTAKVRLVVNIVRSVPVSSETRRNIIIQSTGIIEKTLSINVRARVSGQSSGASESVDSIGKSIDGIGVVEGLSTKNLEQKSIANQR